MGLRPDLRDRLRFRTIEYENYYFVMEISLHAIKL